MFEFSKEKPDQTPDLEIYRDNPHAAEAARNAAEMLEQGARVKESRLEATGEQLDAARKQMSAEGEEIERKMYEFANEMESLVFSISPDDRQKIIAAMERRAWDKHWSDYSGGSTTSNGITYASESLKEATLAFLKTLVNR